MFSIEKATLADCPLIQTLASNIWEPTYGSILSREQLDYMFEMMYSNESLQKQMSELHHQFFIIYADGVPSGYLSIETVEKDLYEFQKIYFAFPTWFGNRAFHYRTGNSLPENDPSEPLYDRTERKPPQPSRRFL